MRITFSLDDDEVREFRTRRSRLVALSQKTLKSPGEREQIRRDYESVKELRAKLFKEAGDAVWAQIIGSEGVKAELSTNTRIIKSAAPLKDPEDKS